MPETPVKDPVFAAAMSAPNSAALEYPRYAPGRLTLRRLQEVNAARMRRWHEGGTREWSVLEWAGAMCGEAGEAANVAKKLLRIELGLRGNEAAEHVVTEQDELRAKLAGEIGGLVLYAALLASSADLDFEQAIVTAFDDKSAAMGFPERLSGRNADG